LNIASTVLLSEGRVTFQNMALEPINCEAEAADVLQSPDVKTIFNVSLD
jgi:hypothetical protein